MSTELPVRMLLNWLYSLAAPHLPHTVDPTKATSYPHAADIMTDHYPTRLCTLLAHGCLWIQVRFLILPDMLKNAPMFKRADPKNKSAPGRGAAMKPPARR